MAISLWLRTTFQRRMSFGIGLLTFASMVSAYCEACCLTTLFVINGNYF